MHNIKPMCTIVVIAVAAASLLEPAPNLPHTAGVLVELLSICLGHPLCGFLILAGLRFYRLILPKPDVNILETVIMPREQPFLGRE